MGLGKGLFVEDPKPSVKAQKSSAKALPSVALGKKLSRNFVSTKRVFAEDPLSGTRQSLCLAPKRHSAKKSSRHGTSAVGGFFTEGRPSSNNFFLYSLPRASLSPRQRFFYLKKKHLPRASSWPSAKQFSGFFQTNLYRGLLPGPSAKELFCRGP